MQKAITVMSTLLLVLIVSFLSIFIVTSTFRTGNALPAQFEQVNDTPMDLEGYNNFEEWLAIYNNNIQDYSGKTETIENDFEDYISGQQVDELYKLEQQILNARTLGEQKKAVVQYESIVTDVKNYESKVEAEKREKEQAKDSTSAFKQMGVIYYNDMRYTWYSQKVLPGGGLKIPGRHVSDDDLIRDCDDYIVVASEDYAYGTVVDTPFGKGKVYDCGCANGTIDIYTNF